MKTQPREKVVTHTTRIYELLQAGVQDFWRLDQLTAETGANLNQVWAALVHLRKHQAVDVVIEADGTGWWFATPHLDQRTKRVDERIVEEPGSRKPRRAKVIALGLVATCDSPKQSEYNRPRTGHDPR